MTAQDISFQTDTSDMDPITPFNFEPNVSTRIEDVKRDNNEIMKWHIKLNHLPFSKLKLMASKGMIQERLCKVSKNDIPVCASCICVKATCKPWRNKTNHKHIHPAQFPGEYVSVDSFESATKGLIGQIKEILYVQVTPLRQCSWATTPGYHTCKCNETKQVRSS